MSIGCVVLVPGRSASVVLGGTTSRPVAMQETATLVLRGAQNDERLRKAIAGDLAANVADADDYQRRLHTATVMKAVREAVG
jgi:CO/xanthine dehydrogenase FAD-binding subunit